MTCRTRWTAMAWTVTIVVILGVSALGARVDALTDARAVEDRAPSAVSPSPVPSPSPGPSPAPSTRVVVVGSEGEPGQDGDPGEQGEPGRSVTDAQIAAAVEAYCAAHDDCRGPAGAPGPVGATGPTGAPGAPGQDGQDGASGGGIVAASTEEIDHPACGDGTDGTIVYLDVRDAADGITGYRAFILCPAPKE